jgi:hypothetical protein
VKRAAHRRRDVAADREHHRRRYQRHATGEEKSLLVQSICSFGDDATNGCG